MGWVGVPLTKENSPYLSPCMTVAELKRGRKTATEERGGKGGGEGMDTGRGGIKGNGRGEKCTQS